MQCNYTMAEIISLNYLKKKDTTPSIHSYVAKAEPREHDQIIESEHKFEEIIGERVKLRKEKADNDDEQLDTIDMPDSESEESAAQRKS